MVYTLIANEYASLLFSQTVFPYCFCMLKKFGKVFEGKVWCVQVAHLHNAACALSSRSWCFQLWTIVDKDFFRYLWYCGKKQIKRGLARSVLLSTIRVITVVKICCETIFSSDTSTKRETASFKICPPTIITSLGVIIVEYEAILGQWECEDFYNTWVIILMLYRDIIEHVFWLLLSCVGWSIQRVSQQIIKTSKSHYLGDHQVWLLFQSYHPLR